MVKQSISGLTMARWAPVVRMALLKVLFPVSAWGPGRTAWLC